MEGGFTHLERSLLPGVALATMFVKPILYLVGRMVSCMWFSCSSVNPDRNRHFPETVKESDVLIFERAESKPFLSPDSQK